MKNNILTNVYDIFFNKVFLWLDMLDLPPRQCIYTLAVEGWTAHPDSDSVILTNHKKMTMSFNVIVTHLPAFKHVMFSQMRALLMAWRELSGVKTDCQRRDMFFNIKRNIF